MGVKKYQTQEGTKWKIDAWLLLPDGGQARYRKRSLPTREFAMALLAKARVEAFEGRYFSLERRAAPTVAALWDLYKPINKRKRCWQTDEARAEHILRHLGKLKVTELSLASVDRYRALRIEEGTRRLLDKKTRKRRPPAVATLNREVGLLKRMLNYAVEAKEIEVNPIAKVARLEEDNIREVVLDEETFQRLHAAAEESLRPILLVAFDTGMRKGEIMGLRWSQVRLKERVIRLAHNDTKTREARAIYLSQRAADALQGVPRRLRCDFVFYNPETGKAWVDIKKMFARAKRKAELEHIWFHDLRRSFVTNARRLGVPESVVMRMSGHRTRTVFDRYNIVDEEDIKAAVERMEMTRCIGQDLDNVENQVGTQKKRDPGN